MFEKRGKYIKQSIKEKEKLGYYRNMIKWLGIIECQFDLWGLKWNQPASTEWFSPAASSCFHEDVEKAGGGRCDTTEVLLDKHNLWREIKEVETFCKAGLEW